MKTFVVFEKGDSGDLTFNQFQQVTSAVVEFSETFLLLFKFNIITTQAVEKLGMELKADQVVNGDQRFE